MVAVSRPSGEGAERRGGRRDAILEAATRLFADRGFDGVSVQEIADAAATHKTTLLYHFGTKDGLHEAVLAEALGRIAEIQRAFFSGPFERDRLAYLIDQIHALYAARPSLARLLQRELLEPGGSDVLQRLFVDPIYLPALRGFERAMERGLVRRVDAALFIHDAHVALVGYFCHQPLLERLRPGFDFYSVDALIARRDYLVQWLFEQLAPAPQAAAVIPRGTEETGEPS